MSLPGFIEPCLPSPADRPPSGPDWIHEIKHDGYRLMARRDPIGVRLLTRNGYDWTPRYPLIVEAVNRLKVRSCLIDGEAVACDENGLAVFALLRQARSGWQASGRQGSDWQISTSRARRDQGLTVCVLDARKIERSGYASHYHTYAPLRRGISC